MARHREARPANAQAVIELLASVLPGLPTWAATGGAGGRHETVQTAGLGLDWDPRPAFTVSTSLREERLSSSLPSSSYNATIFAVAVKARF